MVNQEVSGRHRIFCLMGKSGTGKDTIYRELLSDGALPFERLVPCTTRPIRAGEQDGREYHFYSVEEFRALERAGKVIESRCYETVHGPWYYFTADDGQIDLARRSTLMIGTLESYLALRAYYGADKVVVYDRKELEHFRIEPHTAALEDFLLAPTVKAWVQSQDMLPLPFRPDDLEP